MSNRNMTSAVSGLAVAMLLSVTPLAISVASAQEAITLEQIGAVRMARPDEIQRASAEQQIPQAQQHGQQSREGRS